MDEHATNEQGSRTENGTDAPSKQADASNLQADASKLQHEIHFILSSVFAEYRREVIIATYEDACAAGVAATLSNAVADELTFLAGAHVLGKILKDGGLITAATHSAIMNAANRRETQLAEQMNFHGDSN